MTRRAILDAARSTFAEHGYEGSTIRMIADAACVDHALVIHHFSNKERLFVLAHDLPAEPDSLLRHVASLPSGERGEAIARAFLDVFGEPGSAALSLLRTATTNAAAASMLREFVSEALHAHAPFIVEGDDADFRLTLIGSHLIGIVVYRYVIGIPPLADRPLDEIVAAVGPAIQHYLDVT